MKRVKGYSLQIIFSIFYSVYLNVNLLVYKQYTGMYKLFTDVLKSILIPNHVSSFWIGDITFYQTIEKATFFFLIQIDMKKKFL